MLTTAYQLHVLSCLRDPHAFFKLDPASEIVFAIQSLSAQVARDVGYKRLRDMVDKSPYFQRHFPLQPQIKSEMVFPRNIVVRPLSSKPTAAIGSNIIGGILDEVNFHGSCRPVHAIADGGVYDQALEMYNSLVRRRKSRFMDGRRQAARRCSAWFRPSGIPGEFTDQKQIEAQHEIERQRARPASTSTIVASGRSSRPAPMATPASVCSWATTPVSPASSRRDADVAEEDQHLVMEVPEEFRSEFQRDMLSAIRDIAGSATFAIHPFILNTEAVAAGFRSLPIDSEHARSTDFKSARPAIYS